MNSPRKIFSPFPHPADRKYSISDQILETRELSVHSTVFGLDIDHLNSLLEEAGTCRLVTEQMKESMESQSGNSVIWIEDKAAQKPVAFARAIIDGASFATIWDVAVHPSKQKTGLGKTAIQRLIQDLFHKGVTDVTLLCLPDVVDFYKSLGFVARAGGRGGLRTMVRKLKRTE